MMIIGTTTGAAASKVGLYTAAAFGLGIIADSIEPHQGRLIAAAIGSMLSVIGGNDKTLRGVLTTFGLGMFFGWYAAAPLAIYIHFDESAIAGGLALCGREFFAWLKRFAASPLDFWRRSGT